MVPTVNKAKRLLYGQPYHKKSHYHYDHPIMNGIKNGWTVVIDGGQPENTNSKSIIESLEQRVKYVQSWQ